MNAFVWTIGVLIGFTTIGKIVWLAKGEFPERTAKTEAWDVVMNVAILIWLAAVIAA